MATINYNGMELEEITEPQIFDPPKTMLVWGDCSGHVEDHVKKAEVVAILPRTALKYPIITEDDDGYEHGAFIPEKPAPRRATNRELAKWLAQGNGEWGISKFGFIEKAEIGWFYDTGYEKQTLQSELRVRKWDDTEWHDPTVDYMGIEDKETDA